MGRKYLENIIIKMDSQPERLVGGECGVSACGVYNGQCIM